MEATEQTPLLQVNLERTSSDETAYELNPQTTIKYELKNLFSAGYFLFNVLGLASVVSLGHLGTQYLASMALTTMFCNITGFAVCLGMAGALDTLCSQSFTASDDKREVGRHLQRMLFVQAFLCIPIIYIWLNAAPILVFFGQDREIARQTAVFATYLIPGLYPYVAANCIVKYLQAQGIMVAQFAILSMITPLNFLLQWALVWSPWFSFGAIGSPIATSIAYILMPLALIPYTAFFDGYQCWGGWELDAILDLPQIIEILRLGIPGIVMLCSEWWAFEIMALAAGLFGEIPLAAQTLMLNTCGLLFLFPLGVGTAGGNRIGNLLGENDHRSAKIVSMLTVAVGTGLGLTNALFLFSFKNHWSLLFTSDPEVINEVLSIIPYVAFYQINDGVKAVASGVLQGVGLQKLGATINLTGYYAIGLPLAGILGFYYNFKIVGLWIGLISGLSMVAIVELIIVLFFIDWETEAKAAVARSRGRYLQLMSEEVYP